MPMRLKTTMDVASAVLLTAAVVAVIARASQTGAPEPATRVRPLLVETVTGMRIPGRAVSQTRGSGRVVLVEFSDYECPYCIGHNEATAPRIRHELIDTGTVEHIFVHFPLPTHPRGRRAAEAAACAGKQGRFWDIHEGLFGVSDTETDALVRRAEVLGLRMDAFSTCLRQDEGAAEVRGDVDLGLQLKVVATPTFFVGFRTNHDDIELVTKIRGALPYEVFEAAIQDVSKSRIVARSSIAADTGAAREPARQ